jgi:hypothetical protein
LNAAKPTDYMHEQNKADHSTKHDDTVASLILASRDFGPELMNLFVSTWNQMRALSGNYRNSVSGEGGGESGSSGHDPWNYGLSKKFIMENAVRESELFPAA